MHEKNLCYVYEMNIYFRHIYQTKWWQFKYKTRLPFMKNIRGFSNFGSLVPQRE